MTNATVVTVIKGPYNFTPEGCTQSLPCNMKFLGVKYLAPEDVWDEDCPNIKIMNQGREVPSDYPGAIQTSKFKDGRFIYYISESFDQYHTACNCCIPGDFPLVMKNMLGDDILSYPVGVFNIEGGFLGFAEDQGTFIDLWNSDTVNNTKGVLSAGEGELDFIIHGQSNTVITGMRYWQVDYSGGSIDVFAGANDLYQAATGGPILAASTNPNVTQYGSNGNAQGVWDYSAPACVAMKVLNISSVPLQTCTVFHNEDSNAAGCSDIFAVISPITGTAFNIRGNFPQNVKKVLFKTKLLANNIGTVGILNWSEITSILCVHTWLNSGTFDATFIEPFTQNANLQNVFFIRPGGNAADWGINATNFPVLQTLGWGFSAIAPPAANTLPQTMTQYIDLINTTAALVDAFLIAFDASHTNNVPMRTGDCTGITPTQPGMRANTKTVASAAAVISLQGKGWTI